MMAAMESRAMLRLFALLLAVSMLVPAHAATRAWLDRDRIGVGETTTLHIETDQADAPMPDLLALERDFALSGHGSHRSTAQAAGGGQRPRVLFTVALQPRREGVLTVPALRVGNEATAPLGLTVAPAATAPARAGEPVFIEAEADSNAPWVQQSVGYTLRLYYATPLVSGQLDQPVPDGAAVHRVGSDLQYSRELAGQRYTVVERRFLVVPERSGTLVIPGARFEGTGVGGFFDDMFGGGRRPLRATGPAQQLQVRPVPDGAPQPWLPLHSMELRYLAAPQDLQAGEAASLDVELVADGAAASQLPELRLPPVDGAQVFPEPPQVDEVFERGRPRTRVTRRFAIIPARAGSLHMPGLRQGWWDVRSGVERTATLPDLAFDVRPGAVAAIADDAAQAAFEAGRGDGAARAAGPWRWLAIGFALLWVCTLAWVLRERRLGARARVAAARSAVTADDAAHAPATTVRELMQVLMTGDPGEVEAALLGLASPRAAGLDALSRMFDDEAQRAAIARLQEARWNEGDMAQARQALREAFASGPRWRDRGKSDPVAALLPPLYPERGP